MPKRNEIKNRISADLISMQVYNILPDFKNFNPDMDFDKWACTEVADFEFIPDEMDSYILTDGLYAVFDY